jgi:hypothetical protein
MLPEPAAEPMDASSARSQRNRRAGQGVSRQPQIHVTPPALEEPVPAVAYLALFAHGAESLPQSLPSAKVPVSKQSQQPARCLRPLADRLLATTPSGSERRSKSARGYSCQLIDPT